MDIRIIILKNRIRRINLFILFLNKRFNRFYQAFVQIQVAALVALDLSALAGVKMVLAGFTVDYFIVSGFFESLGRCFVGLDLGHIYRIPI